MEMPHLKKNFLLFLKIFDSLVISAPNFITLFLDAF